MNTVLLLPLDRIQPSQLYISARILAGTREEIEDEIVSKLSVVKESGGYILHSDHSVPNSVSLENYAFAIDLVKRHGAYD